LLWQALRNRKLARWKFRRQHPIDRFTVDFVCLDSKLVIELDGATHSTDQELQQDAERTFILERCGYHVMRFANREVYDNPNGVFTFRGDGRSPSPTSPRWGEVERSEGEGESVLRKGRNPSPAPEGATSPSGRGKGVADRRFKQAR